MKNIYWVIQDPKGKVCCDPHPTQKDAWHFFPIPKKYNTFSFHADKIDVCKRAGYKAVKVNLVRVK